jgi:hypothetical protein
MTPAEYLASKRPLGRIGAMLGGNTTYHQMGDDQGVATRHGIPGLFKRGWR